MITITNDKVAGFSPQWAEFRGFSLLFDNPFEDDDIGLSFGYIGGLLKVKCSMYNAKLKFYRVLKEGLDKISVELLTNTYLFCPLPPESYHVTVWDGVNHGNINDVNISDRMDLWDFLNRLPYSINRSTDFTELIDSSSLVKTIDPIRFRFSKLTRWDKVLVARLETDDENSKYIFDQITMERCKLNESFGKRFGVKPSYVDYSPHISLGYFANSEKAELTAPRIGDWTGEINKVMAREDYPIISFRSISLYGFTDMATFFKKLSSR